MAAIQVPEDVAQLIFQQILLDEDASTFRTAALISSTFLYVAQCHMYRKFTLTIRDSRVLDDVDYLLDIIRRRPYIRTLVKEVVISDQPRVTSDYSRRRISQLSDQVDDTPCLVPTSNPSHLTDLFITNTQNTLPLLFTALPAICTASVVLQESWLDWNSMNTDVRSALETFLFGTQTRSVHMAGVVNIPDALSSVLLSYDRVQLILDHCSFIPLAEAFSSPSLRSNSGRPQWSPSLQHLRLAAKDAIGIDHIFPFGYSGNTESPSIKTLHLAIKGWGAVSDLASVLGIFGDGLEELTLSTTGLELRYLYHQPPPNPFINPHTHRFRLPRIQPHHHGDCFSSETLDDPYTALLVPQIQGYRFHYPVIDKPGWFAELLSPFNPSYHPPLRSLQVLNFEVSHWRSAEDAQSNAELFWVIAFLAELPFVGARSVRRLNITVDVGTDFCMDNFGAMTELVAYSGWFVLDLALTHPAWSNLRSVNIIARTCASCIWGSEKQFGRTMDSLREINLPRLSSRGILDVQYIPLRT